MSLSSLKRYTALTLTTLLIYTSPGLGVYEVLANGIASRAAAVKTGPGIAPVAIEGIGGGLTTPLQIRTDFNVGLNATLPQVEMTPVLEYAAYAGMNSPQAAPLQMGIGVVGNVAVKPVAPVSSRMTEYREDRPWMNGDTNKPPLKGARTLGNTSDGVYVAIKDFGSVSKANAEAASSFGSRIHSLLTGRSRKTGAAGPVLANSARMGGLRRFGAGFQENEGSGFFAKPAGGESIGGAVRAHNGEINTPSEQLIGKEDGGADIDEDSGGVRRSPLPARIFASIVAALPGALIGLPLLAGGMTVAGAAVIAASLGLVTMPFFGERTGRMIRIMPGVLVGALGLWTLGMGVMTGSGIVMGALVALGGWGLIRFGKSENKEYFDEEKVLTAFFGALAAVAGAGLVATTPAALLGALAGWLPFVSATSAWMVTGATWLSYPLAGMLLMHLPGWVGEGITSGVRGVYESFRGLYRVMGSTERDTLLLDRLKQWSEAKLELSKWNVFKVGAVWVPVLIVEAASAVVSFAEGVVLGVLMAPSMFAWGAINDLAEKSRLNKFLASWNRFVFFYGQGSKMTIYNKAAAKIIPIANSENAAVSLIGAAGVKIAQVGWLAYVTVATPFLYVIGFFRAFAQTGGEYDSGKHNPDSIRGRQKGDSPFEKPELPKKPVSDLIPPGIFATGLALLPLYFFGTTMLGVPYLGMAYIAAVLGLAAAPVMPGRAPKFARQVPGYLMTAVGLGAIGAALWLGFGFGAILAVAKSNLFWMGAVAALGGLGFINNISKLAKKGTKGWYSVDDPEYIGAFFGALGVMTGIGLAFTGITGWVTGTLMAVSYLSSGLLLMHLPGWVWDGVGAVFSGAWFSVKSYHKVLNFWQKDTKFYRNMRKQAGYHLKGSLWSVIANATWLSLIWVPTGLVLVAEYVAAFALGAVTGLVRAPINWLRGAAHEINPDAKLTRFIVGFAKGLAMRFEGSKQTVFDKWVARLLPAINESKAPSGRPTVKAVLALGGARILQVLWLAYLVLGSPIHTILALVDGFKNAAGKKDDPNRIY